MLGCGAASVDWRLGVLGIMADDLIGVPARCWTSKALPSGHCPLLLGHACLLAGRTPGKRAKSYGVVTRTLGRSDLLEDCAGALPRLQFSRCIFARSWLLLIDRVLTWKRQRRFPVTPELPG